MSHNRVEYINSAGGYVRMEIKKERKTENVWAKNMFEVTPGPSVRNHNAWEWFVGAMEGRGDNFSLP